MSLVMIKSSNLSPLAFSLDTAFRPAGIFAVAGLTQQHVQNTPNLRNRQSRGVFFSPVAFHKLKTMLQ